MKVSFFCLFLGTALQSVAAQEPASPVQAASDRQAEIRGLRTEVEKISARIAALEAAQPVAGNSATSSSPLPVEALVAATAPALTAEDRPTLEFFRGTTLSFAIDGYYAYNFNQPIGRVNLLRSYDVTSNNFSLNQADIVVEHVPTATPGHRYGGRVDLQFGQATESLQGSSSNEQRPQVWRNLFQAYGSYLAPIGSGLQVDFGKWACPFSVESVYTKDQFNYSRSYLFTFLPAYHMGFRANYNVSPKVNVAYWLVNGTQQTEDFNGFKSQAFSFNLKPAKSLNWTTNYYFGQEQRDVEATLNPVLPSGPAQPGLPTTRISPASNGREHILDTYATWNATSRLTLVGEADYVINRSQQRSSPTHVSGGAAYLRYSLPPKWAIAARVEYLSDRGGLFSGTTQALKEITSTLERQLEPGLITRLEYRRDFSNQRFFLTDRAGVLSNAQNTATLGMVYWWGMKQGSW